MNIKKLQAIFDAKSDSELARSRAGMKRLADSRCCVCEAWIGYNVELPSANGMNRCRVACSVDCRDAAAKEVR